MTATSKTNRRAFFGRMFGAAAVASLPIAEAAEAAQATKSAAAGPDSWIAEVKGTHRTLFDFPQHKNGFPLVHILNYLNTYKEGYKAAPATVGAVGTFYSMGNQSS